MKYISDFIQYIQEFNTVSVIIRILLSILLGGLIGIERSKSGRAAGLRTHILVCLGSAVASMTGLYINATVGGDASRIAAQVISGLGFLGSGVILVRNHTTITGLTTAACVWAVGAIGIATGYGFYEVAIITTLFILFINNGLNRIDKRIRHNMKDVGVYVEFVNVKKLNDALDYITELNVSIDTIELVPSKTHLQDGIGAELILHVPKQRDGRELVGKINDIENVHFAILKNH